MEDFVNLTIVTYNRLKCTKRCLASILEQTNYPFVLTIIDNNSTDNTRSYLKEIKKDKRYAKHINRIIFLEKNMGISPAYNLGWILSDAPYYMKIDNDVEFLRENWLQSLVTIANENKDAAMIGFGKNSSGVMLKDKLYCQGHVGGCTLIRRDVHKKIGFWTEDYGLYGEEDADYGHRARLAGYYNLTFNDDAPFIRYVDKLDCNYQNYKDWKDQERINNINSIFGLNDILFKCGFRDLYVERMYIPYPQGDTFTFKLNREYIIKLESLKKKYLPHLHEIMNTKEFKDIQKTLNFFY
jgi:glycosyltransferase involved in cell wall biosynthesis